MTRLLFNCDDFGRSHPINAAILLAHREGLLGSASLMVTGEAFESAVMIARSNRSLKVGLHVALTDARPLLRPERIPDLVTHRGFLHSPAIAGLQLAACAGAREQAVREIRAQFERFMSTGLTPYHVDGHHHLHMHPFVFRECIRCAKHFGFQRIRLTREFGSPLPPRRDDNRFAAKLAYHFTFRALSSLCRRMLGNGSPRCLDGLLGLWETGRMNEAYLHRAIPRLPGGDWEIYVHLGSDGAEEELPALMSPALKEMLTQRQILLL